jgi:hypothetical protein
MRNKEFYVPGVIIAGLVGIVPAIGGNCCCCGVVTATFGLLAVYLVRRKSGGVPIEAGEGALIGLISGGITAALAIAWTIVSGVLGRQAISQLQAQLPGGNSWAANFSSGPVGIVIQSILCLVVHGGGGTLGGLVAVPILKTSASASPAAPPA